MVICFYPGSGGNRYLRYTQGLEYSTSGVMYDGHNPDHIRLQRYFDGEFVKPGLPDVLSHCVNVPHVKRIFPEQQELVVIRSSLQKSLRRLWVMNEHSDRTTGRTDRNRIDTAFSVIVWHLEYYSRRPLEVGDAMVINLDHPACEFSYTMAKELDCYQSEIFDLAWDSVASYGSNAPILDIFDAKFSASN